MSRAVNAQFLVTIQLVSRRHRWSIQPSRGSVEQPAVRGHLHDFGREKCGRIYGRRAFPSTGRRASRELGRHLFRI
jgi:hypothetical protein